MPARTLSDEPTTIDPFDVLGKNDGSSNLMLHALLCNETATRTDVTRASTIECSHMGPPLGQRRYSCDVVGAAGLSDDHRRKIKVFVDERLNERAAEKERRRKLGLRFDSRVEYRIHPPATRPSGTFPLWRFSCVGFVLQAYQAARIQLLGSPLPLKSLDELKRLYPFHAQQLGDPETRARLGIGEGDRWPVVLVGYVINSLSRSITEIHEEPYVPQSGDEYFPAERLVVASTS